MTGSFTRSGCACVTIVSAARNCKNPAVEHDAGNKAITVRGLAKRFYRENITIRMKESTAMGIEELQIIATEPVKTIREKSAVDL